MVDGAPLGGPIWLTGRVLCSCVAAGEGMGEPKREPWPVLEVAGEERREGSPLPKWGCGWCEMLDECRLCPLGCRWEEGGRRDERDPAGGAN